MDDSKLDDLIRNRREAFDKIEHVPRESLWEGISAELDRKNRRPISMWMAIAASLVVMFIAGVLVSRQFWSPQQETVVSDWSQQQEAYQELISHRIQTVGFDTLRPDQFPDLQAEFRSLQEEFDHSTADLAIYPNNESALRVLIRYHERQLSILEKLEKEINRQEKEELNYEKRLY